MFCLEQRQANETKPTAGTDPRTPNLRTSSGGQAVTRDQINDEVHQRLGYRRLSRTWAKLEILLGLLAAGVGLFLGQYALSRPSPEWELAAPA